ncbi:unnamed protein product [Paramecium sonneborni]|uniref:Transmembrane protein n=1 Tax=Paramecium sonneborni TaxID=65129 RepID=A0A8S1Q5T3_9CILI|nr:unnamed protein product [Paramecium sonneborni]
MLYLKNQNFHTKKENQIKNDFIRLCKEQNQICYYKFQIRSPYFQFFIQLFIASIFSQSLLIAQFIILKIRYDLINTYFIGEKDQIIKQLLNVYFMLLSMITFVIFYQIGTKIFNRLALQFIILQLFINIQNIIFYIFQLQCMDFEKWNIYLNLIVPAINSIFGKKLNCIDLKQKKLIIKLREKQISQFNQENLISIKKQIAMSKIISISMMFGLQYQLIIPFSMLSLLIVYQIDKYLFINYAIPVLKDKYEEMLQGGYFLFNIIMLFVFFQQCFFFLFFKDWITIILYIIFILIQQLKSLLIKW